MSGIHTSLGALAIAAALLSCSDYDDGYGSGTDTSTDTTADAPADGAGDATGTIVNGCDRATAEDRTGAGTTTIEFGGAHGDSYSPACVRVTAGTAVTFAGDAFAIHPLTGGTAEGGQATPDPTSPLMPVTDTGTSKTFTLGSPGTYPFYCAIHHTLGMRGAIFVE